MSEYTNDIYYINSIYASDSFDNKNYSNDLNGKICFAILVHNQKDCIIDLLDNIRCYCPNSSVVLYNGGDDPKLCQELGYPVCPTSRKLSYGVTGIYMLEIMKWLKDIRKDYDYLINLDSDVLFAQEGFESYIINEMNNKNYMGVGTKIPENDFSCLVQLRFEKDRWESVLGQEPYYESFNVGQVYSKILVQSLLSNEKYNIFHKNLLETRAFGGDELVFVTFADRLSFQIHPYPKGVASSIRYRPHFPLDEFIHHLNQEPSAYLFHPIYRQMKDETRNAIRELMKRNIQIYHKLHESLINKKLGQLPYMLRRSKYRSTAIEWIVASDKGGLQYWKVSAGTLYGPYSFGSGKVRGISAMESSFGNIEVICWIDDYLVHYWRDEQSAEWYKSDSFAESITGMPSCIESSYGNFEVVASLEGGGLGHWWRNNGYQSQPWFGPTQFGESHYSDAILVENNSKQLTTIVVHNGKYNYFIRDDRNSWQWFGPYD